MSEPLLKYRQPIAPQDILTEAVPARLYTEGSGLNLTRAALFGVGLDKVTDIVKLLRTYRGGRPNSLIMGGPMGWTWYSTLDTTHHGALAGPANAHRHSDLANIGIDDHHARDHATRHHSGGADALALGSIAGNLTDAQHGSRTVANAHAHSHLSGIGVNDHHNKNHALIDTTGHTVSGLTAGHFLKATSATAYAFQAHGLAAGDVGAEPAIGAGTTAQYWRGDKSWQTLLGETSATAYRGDRGTTAYDHSQSVTGAVHGAVSTATANMIARRDSGGRSGFAAPAASGDALIKGTQLTLTEMPRATANLLLKAKGAANPAYERAGKESLHWTADKLLKGAGAGADPTEIDGDNAFYGLLSQGLASARPAAGVAGRLYYSTDTKVLERDNGTAWDEIARGETVTRLASLLEKAHASLTGVTSDQHHAQSHNAASHSDITSSGASIDDAVSKRHSQNTDSDLSPAHKDVATGVHGVGASTVESASGAQSKVDTHAGVQTAGVHGSASAATVNKLVHRDASGRAKIAAPSASDDIAQKAQADTVQTNLDTHAALTTAHSAVSTATASRIVVRDASARAKFAAPAAAGDALIKGTRLAANEMLDGASGLPLKGAGAGVNPAYGRIGKSGLEWTAGKLLKGAGAGADPTEIDVLAAELIVGDGLMIWADTEQSQSYTTPVKKKEINVGNGALRIKFGIRSSGTFGIPSAFGRVYRNGGAVGTARSTDGTTWVTYSEDISGWSAGDLCQLYIWSAGSAPTCYIRNFRIYIGRGLWGTVALD